MNLTQDQIAILADSISKALPGLIQQTLAAHGTTLPPSIRTEDRPYLDCNEAARLLGPKPQTLRWWAATEKGLLRPHRVGKRLLWNTDEIRALLAPKGSKTKAVSE